jgi:hypothetical protein
MDQFVSGGAPPLWKMIGNPARYSQAVVRGLHAFGYRGVAGFGADAMKQKGLESQSEEMREVVRQATNHGHNAEIELNEAAKIGDREIWKLLETNEGVQVGTRRSDLNRAGAPPPLYRAFDYLRGIAATGDEELWGSDIIVQTLSRMWQAPGDVGEHAEMAARSALKKLVEGPGGPMAFKRVLEGEGKIRGIWFDIMGRTDAQHRAFRDLARAIAHAANLKDAIDTVRAATHGVDVNEDVVRAMNWFADPHKPAAGETFKPESIQKAFEASAKLGAPLAKTVRGRDLSNRVFGPFMKGTRKQEDLLNVAYKDANGEVYLPKAYMDALRSIPDKLAKEMEAFPDHGLTSYVASGLRNLLRTWRAYLSMHPGSFAREIKGNWAQSAVSDGFGKATRTSIQALVANLPVFGAKIQDLQNPLLARVMAGDPSLVVETVHGPMNGDQLLHWMIGAGMHDAFGTDDLMRMTSRRQDSGIPKQILDIITMQDVGPITKMIQRKYEDVQMRQRALYLLNELADGSSQPEAAAKLRRAYFDYRTSVPESESSLMGWAGSFWTWKRNQLRQQANGTLDTILNPDWRKGLSGQTYPGRVIRAGRVMSQTPRIAAWSDPEYGVDDSTVDRLGQVHGPWWNRHGFWIGNWRNSPEAVGFHKEMFGKNAKVSGLVWSDLVFADALANYDILAQTAGWMLPIDNTVDASNRAVYERHISGLVDTLSPGVDTAIEAALKKAAKADDYNPPYQTLSQDQTTAFRDLMPVLEEMGLDPADVFVEENGALKIRADVYASWGTMAKIFMAHAGVQSAMRNYRHYRNPQSNNKDFGWFAETVARATGLYNPHAIDPATERDKAVGAQQRRMSDTAKDIRKEKSP